MKRADTTAVRLGDVLASPPIAGTRQTDDGEGDRIPFVSASLVSSGIGTIDEVPDDRTSRAAKGRLATRGDILLASRGVERRPTVPAAIVGVDQRLAFSESLVLIRVDPDKADPEYVRLYLTSTAGAAALAAVAAGATITYLRPESLMGLTLHLPSIDEQRRAAAKVAALNTALASLEATADAYRALVAATTEGIITGTLRPRPRNDPGRERAGGRR